MIAFSLLSVGALQARIGETKKEVAERYGKPTFTHDSAAGTYSRYNFKGKSIEVVFVGGEEKYEAIHFPREKVYSSEQARALGKQSGEFVISLLTNVYGFTKEKAAEVLMHRGRLVGYGKEAAQYNLNYKLIAQKVFAAQLTVQQNEMEDDLVAKCNQVLKAGLKALRAKELNKKSSGF